MSLKCTFIAAMMLSILSATANQLRYDEAAEKVFIDSAQGTRVYQYREHKNGFVSPQGDWVGWNTQGEYWESIPKDGGRARYNLKGKIIAREKVVVKPAPRSGYDPREDLGDSSSGSGDISGAANYLQQRSENSASSRALVGEEYGSPIEEGTIGGPGAAKEKADREAWANRPGVHSGDPEAAMDTGEVPDPLKKLADTVEQIQTAVQSVDSTIAGVSRLDDQIKNIGEDDYEPAPLPGVMRAPESEENEDQDEPGQPAVSSARSRPVPVGSSIQGDDQMLAADQSGLSSSPEKKAGTAYGKPPGSPNAVPSGNSMPMNQK